METIHSKMNNCQIILKRITQEKDLERGMEIETEVMMKYDGIAGDDIRSAIIHYIL